MVHVAGGDTMFCATPGRSKCLIGRKPCLVAAFYARLELQRASDERLWQAVLDVLIELQLLTAMEQHEVAKYLAAGRSAAWQLLALLEFAPTNFVFRRPLPSGAHGNVGGLTPLAVFVTMLWHMVTRRQ